MARLNEVDGRTRWPGFPDAGESSGGLAPTYRARVCGLSIENLVKKERHEIWDSFAAEVYYAELRRTLCTWFGEVCYKHS